jgi:hypothetical protein
MQTLSSAVLSSTKTVLGQAGKIGVPIMALLAAIADTAEPLGPIAFGLAIVLMIIGAISASVYYFRFRRRYLIAMADGKLSEEEGRSLLQRNVWSVCYSFCAVGSIFCWILVGMQQFSSKEDRGFLGSAIEPIAKFQDSLFSIQKDVADIKTTTEGIRQSTSRIEGKVDAVQSDLKSAAQSMVAVGEALTALGRLGGMVADPKNPAEFVHNARMQARSGAYGPARASFERAFELGYRPYDVAREYVESVVARDGADLALPMVLRWLDPAGSAYSVVQGKPVVAGTRAPGDVPLSVEAAVSTLIKDWEARRAFLRALLGNGERALPICIAVVEAVAPKPIEVRTRADNLLLRDAVEQANALVAGRAIESLYLDLLRAAAARDSIAAAGKGIEGWPETYWRGEPKWTVRSQFNSISIYVRVPDRSEVFECSFRGRTFEAKKFEADPTEPGVDAWSPVWVYNVDAGIGQWPAKPESEQLVIRYKPLGSTEVVAITHSFDGAAVCIEEARRRLEGVSRVEDGRRVFEEHGPGVRALRAEYRAMGLERAVDLTTSRSWREDHQPKEHTCYSPYWMCEAADPKHKGFRCGNPLVDIQTVPDMQEGPAQVGLAAVLQWRHALKEVRYSLGSPSLEHRIEFTPLPTCVDEGGIPRVAFAPDGKGRKPLLAATGGHVVEGNSIRIEDRFSGPFYIQLVYKDGIESAAVKYDLINPEAPPEGYPELPLVRPTPKPKETQTAKENPAASSTESATGVGLTEQVKKLPGRKVETGTFRKPYGYENEIGGLVAHGRFVVRSADGSLLSEALVADGIPYATIFYDDQGRPAKVECRSPIWEGDATIVPAGSFVYGLSLVYQGGVLVEEDSCVMGNPDDSSRVPVAWDDRPEQSRRPLTREEIAWGQGVRRIEDLTQEVGCSLVACEVNPYQLRSEDPEGRYSAAFPTLTQEQQILRRTPFTRGRGLLVDGIPMGWWTELGGDGKPAAQGWVCRRKSPRGPFAARMGRWTMFDGEGNPKAMVSYDAQGFPLGVFLTADPQGQLTSFGLARLTEIRACWAKGLPLYTEEPDITEEWVRKHASDCLPLVGPTR